jgi:hypothetical protein
MDPSACCGQSSVQENVEGSPCKTAVYERVSDRCLAEKMGGNCLRSYHSLEKATDGWCSHSTIENWLKAQPTFATYFKKVRPGLTEANREKQVQFAKHVFSNWGLPRTQKILWTMSDENWWYGLVLRTFAKMCPALGIDKEVFTCHHKKHIGTYP